MKMVFYKNKITVSKNLIKRYYNNRVTIIYRFLLEAVLQIKFHLFQKNRINKLKIK